MKVSARPVLFGATILFLACGGDGTSGPEQPGSPANLTITQEPGDTASVTKPYPSSFTVQVTDSSETPVPGQLVNFVANPSDCATTQSGATSLETSDQGEVSFSPVADTLATTAIGPCFLKAVQSGGGQANLTDSLSTTILPGPIVEVPSAGDAVGDAGSSLTWPGDWIRDRYANPGLWRIEVSTVDSFPLIQSGDTMWVTRASSDVVAVQGSIPGTQEAWTIEEKAIAQDQDVYAALCFVGGGTPQDSLVVVASAYMGPNVGMQTEVHWSAQSPAETGDVHTLTPEHCPGWSP